MGQKKKIVIRLEEKGRGDKKYTIAQEGICDKWFRPWAERWLDEALRQSTYELDWSGTTRGHNCIAELKTREFEHDRFKGCYIEAGKYANLLNEWLYKGNEPLYFARYKDGVIVEWNLRKLKHPPVFVKTRAENKELSIEMTKKLAEEGIDAEVTIVTETDKGDLLIDDAIAIYDSEYNKIDR